MATLAIARRDLIASFTTPLAWLVIATWSLVTNGIFVLFALHRFHGGPVADQPLYVITLSAGVWVLLFLAPAVTMNSFASERAQGTMQLLLTVPVRETSLVLGKFLSAFALLATLAATTLAQVAILVVVSQVDLPHLLAAYGGYLLLCALLAALGVWISLLVDSPVTAYVLTFGVIFALLLVTFTEQYPMLAPVHAAFAVLPRTQHFLAGEVRLADAAWFAVATATFLLLSHTALCARRIHG
jgi:ABC-2 type transport system permease protein